MSRAMTCLQSFGSAQADKLCQVHRIQGHHAYMPPEAATEKLLGKVKGSQSIKPREFSYCCWPGEIRPKDTKGDIATDSSYVDCWAMFGLNLHIMASNTSVHLKIGYPKHVMLVIYFPYWKFKRPFRCIHYFQPVSQILQISCFRNLHHIVFGVASLSCPKGFEKLQNLSPNGGLVVSIYDLSAKKMGYILPKKCNFNGENSVKIGGNSGKIKRNTDLTYNRLEQPW